MKAARLYGVHDIRIEELPQPKPGPGEVLLRIKAVGLCGSDLHYYKEGGIGDAKIIEPLILGHEFSAQVVALGPGVTGLAVGQAVAVEPANACRVCEFCREGNPNLCPDVIFAGSPGVDGAMREYMTYPARLCYPLPHGLTYDDGAVLEPLGIAVHATDLGKIRVGRTVAVVGCGPIGLLNIQVARAAGASRIFATEILDYRLDAALETGATAGFNPTREDVVVGILKATDGRGVDVVFECAGAQETPEQAMQICKPGGTVVLVGIPSIDRVTFTASTARRKGLTIKMVRRMREVYERAMALVESGQVKTRSVVTHHFPLERVSEAMDLLDRYGDGAIKIIIEP